MNRLILHAQKMEAVGRLAGEIAHDFNNWLTIIAGHNELLLRRLSPTDPVRRHAEGIRKAVDGAAALSRQLLTLSRRQILQPTVLDLTAVVGEVEKMLQCLLGENIDVVSAPDPGLAWVKADPGQLQQILLHLAVNARDAMPQGGTLTIRMTNVALDAALAPQHGGVQPGPYVLLEVSDTGCGMTAEVQSHLFEPFFTTKERGKGTGLGLATVYGIVTQSGGHIAVESEPGRGSTFRIYLPQVEEGDPGGELHRDCTYPTGDSESISPHTRLAIPTRTVLSMH